MCCLLFTDAYHSRILLRLRRVRHCCRPPTRLPGRPGDHLRALRLQATCFAYEGVEAIRAALTAGEEQATADAPIKITLIAPPKCADRPNERTNERTNERPNERPNE